MQKRPAAEAGETSMTRPAAAAAVGPAATSSPPLLLLPHLKAIYLLPQPQVAVCLHMWRYLQVCAALNTNCPRYCCRCRCAGGPDCCRCCCCCRCRIIIIIIMLPIKP
jgi:hypothetical protein